MSGRDVFCVTLRLNPLALRQNHQHRPAITDCSLDAALDGIGALVGADNQFCKAFCAIGNQPPEPGMLHRSGYWLELRSGNSGVSVIYRHEGLWGSI